MTRKSATLHQDVRTFMIIPCWIPLRIRNISDKYCGENQNHILGSNASFKKSSFMRKCGIVHERTSILVLRCT